MPSTPSPVAEALRRRAAARAVAAPLRTSANTGVQDRRPLTPLQALLVDSGTIAGAVCAVTGFVVLGFGWRGVAGTLDVQVQVAYLASGGLAGLALVGMGCALLSLQADRYVDVLERRAWGRLAGQWQRLDAVVRALGEDLEDEAGGER